MFSLLQCSAVEEVLKGDSAPTQEPIGVTPQVMIQRTPAAVQIFICVVLPNQNGQVHRCVVQFNV
ncbi:UNVERIFIED_CONTAM: hypothetical protein K2H54_057072, partial [Gekko kuhli]